MSSPAATLPARLLGAAVVCTCAAIWLLGESLIFRDNASADGKPGLSILDLQLRFTEGGRSLFEARVLGDMRQHLRSDMEESTLLSWAREGGARDRFERTARVVLEERCLRCHRSGGEAGFRPLETYAQVRATLDAPAAPSVRHQLLVTKIHLFGVGALIAVVASLLIVCGRAPHWQAPLVCGAYLGLATDFAAWWLMRSDPRFAWGRLGGNLLMSACFGAMAALVLLNTLRPFDRRPRS